ncbi:copper resistance CopC family protein [Paenibacillus campi]|uniref:copper resistance CopC family protein n=1 Tax=Paenibacillus campi TaxID=3106031 RepID=UPI002AFF7A1B|nr:copper resistance CopC family protein [Paenibacillus sp. SGZ-1014]
MSISQMLSRKTIFSALGIMLLWLTIPLTAFAHTSLESATPGKDEQVQQAVSEIQMNFNTPIAALSSFTVDSTAGDNVVINDIQVDRSAMSGKLAQPLTSGTYTVHWKIVGEDSHPIEGSYTFTVAASDAATNNAAESSVATDTEATGVNNTDTTSNSTSDSTAANDSKAGETDTSSATDKAVQNPAPALSDTETTPADDATTDQQPTNDSTLQVPPDEKDNEHVSPVTWIITIAVVLIAIIAAVTTISKRRKR